MAERELLSAIRDRYRASSRKDKGLTMYHPLQLRARKRNRTAAYRREQKGRRIDSEDSFASLDRLGWARFRLRGLWRVDCEG